MEELVADGGVSDGLLKVDRLTLRRSLIDLAQMLASGEKAIVICPLHAETFAAASAWRQFEQIVYGLTAEMRSLLIFDIVDAMAVGTDRKLVDMVRNLSRYARQVVARVPLHGGRHSVVLVAWRPFRKFRPRNRQIDDSLLRNLDARFRREGDLTRAPASLSGDS